MTSAVNIQMYIVAGALAAPLTFVFLRLLRGYAKAEFPPWLSGVLVAAMTASALLRAPDLPELVCALGLGWTLLTLAAIDLHTLRLPDPLTVGLTAAGLIRTALWRRDMLPDCIAGAAGGYITFTTLAWAYRHLRNRHGLGQGDAKLLAAAGAWLGWRDLPLIVLVASLGGLAWAFWKLWRANHVARTPIAFGPPLAAAIWLCWLSEPPF